MAILNDEPVNTPLPPTPAGRSHYVLAILALVLGGAVGIAQFHFSSRLNSLETSLQAQQAASMAQLNQSVSQKLADIQSQDAQALDAVRSELDMTKSTMTSSQRKALYRANSLVARLRKEEAANAQQLQQQIASKADAQQVGSLSQDVKATQNDLASTKQTMTTLTSDLGMARSSMGTLIARNHQDIQELRRLGTRDYYEFKLTRGQKETVAGVSMILKKANYKHHMFNIDMIADDMTITKKNRSINEPIFFAVNGQRSFYELVVNSVGSNEVTGYISTPKGAVTMASAASH